MKHFRIVAQGNRRVSAPATAQPTANRVDHRECWEPCYAAVKRLFFSTVLILGVGTWAPCTVQGQEQNATATVIDGDTLEVDGNVLRLYGIDAPELGQTCLNKSTRWRCGLQAALEMRRMMDFWGQITCVAISEEEGEPRFICHNSRYDDPAEVLLSRGFAVTMPNTIPAYKRAEVSAKRAKLGIWRGEFVPPLEWRQGVRLSGPADSPGEVCDVKGIITDKGDRVYYVSTDKNYEEMALQPDRGERMFCSDDAAELAGWRRSPRGRGGT